MKKTATFLLILFLFFSALFGITRITKNGHCAINKCGPFDKEGLFPIEVKNSMLSMKFEIRGHNSFGYFCLSTTPSMKNLAENKLHVAYNIAFFDSMGKLIACTSSSTDLDRGADNFFAGSNMPEIPEEELHKIVRYQVVVYISKK